MERSGIAVWCSALLGSRIAVFVKIPGCNAAVWLPFPSNLLCSVKIVDIQPVNGCHGFSKSKIMNWKHVQPCEAKKQVHVNCPVTNSFYFLKHEPNCGIVLLVQVGKIQLLGFNFLCQINNVIIFPL